MRKLQPTSADSSRPNLLLVFAEQHHADVFSGAGHRDVLTPNPTHDYRAFEDMLLGRERNPLEPRNLMGTPEQEKIDTQLHAHLKAWRT